MLKLRFSSQIRTALLPGMRSSGSIFQSKLEMAIAMVRLRSFFILALLVTAHTSHPKKAGKKRKDLYNKFERNQIIDSTIHPLADQSWVFVLIDGALHALNEQDPMQSFMKFLKYNAPELLKRIIKDFEEADN